MDHGTLVDEPRETIGSRVRRLRRYRGMSLQLAADRAGLSKSFLSMVENGQRRLERRSHIAALADALEMSVADLTGQPYPPTERERSGGHAAVPRVRLALVSSNLGEPVDVPTRPLTELAADTTRVERLCEASDYGRFGRLLPDLLPELHVIAAEGDEVSRTQALELLVRALHATFYLLKDLGYLDLAQIAVAQARAAADALGEPAFEGLAAFLRTHAVIPAGGHTAALKTASGAADRLQTHMDDPAAGQVYGMLHLSAALACASANRGGDADAHLDEAADAAAHTGEGDAFGLHFGPTNVGFWRVALAVEQGRGTTAVKIADGIRPELLDSPGRQASFFADVGRGLAQMGKRDREAIAALRRAEGLAPEQVRNNPLVREVVANMLERSRATAGGRDLRGLAYRMGVR